jgi:hypothetical protein
MLDKLKWLATSLLILGFGGVAAGIYEFIFIQLFGGVLWLVASVAMKDRPLIVTNGIMTGAGIVGVLLKYYL